MGIPTIPVNMNVLREAPDGGRFRGVTTLCCYATKGGDAFWCLVPLDEVIGNLTTATPPERGLLKENVRKTVDLALERGFTDSEIRDAMGLVGEEDVLTEDTFDDVLRGSPVGHGWFLPASATPSHVVPTGTAQDALRVDIGKTNQRRLVRTFYRLPDIHDVAEELGFDLNAHLGKRHAASMSEATQRAQAMPDLVKVRPGLQQEQGASPTPLHRFLPRPSLEEEAKRARDAAAALTGPDDPPGGGGPGGGLPGGAAAARVPDRDDSDSEER